MSFHDTYLLFIKDSGENLGMARLQIDDTLNVRTKAFMKRKEKGTIEAKFKAKNRIILETGISGHFNDCRMRIETESIIVLQKNQPEKLVLFHVKDDAKKQQYEKQRACGACIGSIWPPEATFDYSIPAQSKEPSDENIAIINKRIQQQFNNKLCGLRFKAIDISTAKLFVFID